MLDAVGAAVDAVVVVADVADVGDVDVGGIGDGEDAADHGDADLTRRPSSLWPVVLSCSSDPFD